MPRDDYIGQNTAINITGASVVIKSGPGTVYQVNVTGAGTTNGGIYNANSTASLTNANQVANIPNQIGSYAVNAYCSLGIAVNPGATQNLTITYT